MTTVVFGTYQNGEVILDESLPIATQRAKVIVTVVEELGDELAKPKRQLGLLKGQIHTEDGFNDPIEDLNEYM